MIIKLGKMLLAVALLAWVGWFAGLYFSQYLGKQRHQLQGDFQEYISEKPALYVAQGCSACKLAIAYIHENNKRVEIRDVSANSAWVKDLNALGITSVPVLIEPSKVTIGFSALDFADLK